MADDPIAIGLVVLYQALGGGDDFDLSLIGATSASPATALKDLAVAVDIDRRRDRYGANLAYVLATRCQRDGIGGLTSAKQELGRKIVGRFDAADAGAAADALDGAVARMVENRELTLDIADLFVTAFGTGLEFTDLGGKIQFRGAAAETATMLTEMSCMDFGLAASSVPGTVTAASGDRTEVFKFDHEVCTPLSWERMKLTIDPRQWPVYNPGFFHSVQVVNPTVVTTPTGWMGVVQESVGILPTTGNPAITNLTITYHETSNVAVTAYDLGPDEPGFHDDGFVTVDYGFFGVIDEGDHRRMRMVKVLHIDGFEKWPKWIWLLWAHEVSLSGYLFEEPGP